MKLLGTTPSTDGTTTFYDQVQSSTKHFKSFSRVKTITTTGTNVSMFNVTVSAGNPYLNFHMDLYWANQVNNIAGYQWAWGMLQGLQCDTSGNWGSMYGPGGAYTGTNYYENYGTSSVNIGTFNQIYTTRVWTFQLRCQDYAPMSAEVFVDIWCNNWSFATINFL